MNEIQFCLLRDGYGLVRGGGWIGGVNKCANKGE